MSEDEAEEVVLSMENLQTAMDDLQKLYQIRGQISQKLGSISAKQQVRAKIIETLYHYYDMTQEDVMMLEKGFVDDVDAVITLGEGFDEQKKDLEEIIQRAMETLLKPIKPLDQDRALEESQIHAVYALNAQYRIGKKLAEAEGSA